ncbi:MAG: hypothetical protein MUF53_03840 [Gemmatimonadaceae bacterium]|jgi:hypothetical protein|nr:hypothetical protein [Gemmatimonadaceae bacterium]
MAGLGSKEAFYLDLIRDAWAPLTARREVRQATWVLLIGLFCIGGGGYAMLVSADFTPFFAGLAFTGWGGHTLWQYRGALAAWWRIGPTRLEFTAGALVTGEIGTFELVVSPRRRGEITGAALTLWCRDSRGPAASSPWHQGLVYDAAIPPAVPLAPRTETRVPLLVALDPAAPPSRFERDYTRQWFATCEMVLADGRRWTREYPVVVQPGGMAVGGMAGGSAVTEER